MDYEAELGVVIGRPCKNVSPQDALSYVLSYLVNDVSARLQRKRRRPILWKSFDTFCPVGPCGHGDEIRIHPG